MFVWASLGTGQALINLDSIVDQRKPLTMTPLQITHEARELDGNDLLTALEASKLLGVKQATLYTYVSRGWLHPVRHASRKEHRYQRDEVERLKIRSTAHHGHGPVAAGAMRWGQPVIETAITEISDLGPRFRGHLASDLVRHPGSFENVAELLWSGILTDMPQIWPIEVPQVNLPLALDAVLQEGRVNPRMMRVFSIVATTLGGGTLAEELRSGSIEQLARQMLFGFVGACGLLGPERRFVSAQGEWSIAGHVLNALGVNPTPQAEHAVNAALILGADHELSPGTFSARIAASTGATLHASIVAALATHQGTALAGGADTAEDIIMTITSSAELDVRIAEVERRRQRLSGFGVPTYPKGDPRATALIELTQRTAPGSIHADLAYKFVERVTECLGLHPNIEMGLVILSIGWNLPRRSPSALWGIGRTTGWIAHILEQRLAGFTIRPRGIYQSRR